MKKVKGLFLAALSAALMFTSCTDEDAVGPEITFPNNGDKTETIKIGESIIFQADVKKGDAKLDITGVKVTLALAGATQVIKDVDITDATDGFKVVVSHTFLIAGEYTFTFDAVDKDEKAATVKTKKVIVGSADVAFDKEITSGEFFHADGKDKGAWNLDTDVAESSDATSSIQNVDVAGKAFTGAFKSENGTSFYKAALDYATVTKTEAMAAVAAVTAVATVTPVADDVYVAVKGSTYYVIKITGVDAKAGTGLNLGKVTFTYKK